ncbi:MAG: IS21 family transposase [Actinomycetota bacterium]
MRKIKEVLRLAALGHSRRAIGRSIGISHSTVALYLEAVEAAGLTGKKAEGLSEVELESRLFPPPETAGKRPVPACPEIERELRRPGVTLQLLWYEHKQAHPRGHQYSQFCTLFRSWKGSLDRVLRQEHKAGEKVFVDYAGQTVPIIDRTTGEEQQAQIFVGVLGASNFTFAEATWTQDLSDWVGSHVRMLAFFGSVPQVVVPDNLASGVRHASYYEPDINPTYHEMARHYGTTVIPARVRRPRDKAKAEAGVLLVERWILARLRNHTFFSLSELNREIARLLDELNDRPFQKLSGSRRTRFEELDRPAMQPLPEHRYEYAQWKKARVHKVDYHVAVGGHHYSAPHRLAGEPVDVRCSASAIEIFHRGERVAAHPRSRRPGGYTTEPGHRPKSHQQHLDWSPERMIRWASQTGPSTAAVVEEILRTRPHPEQGYRACLGIIRLGKRYSDKRLEAACARAVEIGGVSYRSIESILKNGLDQQRSDAQTTLSLPQEHAHVRGRTYYTPSN